MDAWEILSGNSTEPLSSDTWTHLNNQQGGAGGDTYMTPVQTLTFNPISDPLVFEFNNLVLSVEYPTIIEESSEGNLDLKMEIVK